MEKLFKDIEKKSLVRVSTAGSVDDGKSTLIGRLLFDCNALMKDQIVNLENSSNNYGYEKLNLAYITDGLRSEREKAITIDVAYRYFSTKKCKFILADTPGHFEYTRNMVTGASLADILLLVLDINSGITNQTKRHLKLASLLRISNVTVCINKMDLVSYDKNLFEKISVQLKQLAFSLGIDAINIIPISALNGDNVAIKSNNMAWYDGLSILDTLESNITLPISNKSADIRLSIQSTLKSNGENYYQCFLYSGKIVKGQSFLSLPSSKYYKAREIFNLQGQSMPIAEAKAAVTITLDDHDEPLQRGDLLVSEEGRPEISCEVKLLICWFDPNENLKIGARYHIIHHSNNFKCKVSEIDYVFDLNENTKQPTDSLKVNDIGLVTLKTELPTFIDKYDDYKSTGTVILVDPIYFNSVAVGWKI